ncbi:MAG: ABC transporter permease [Proteobacteria bacterium]|nr:ABC transporter permease [Pseudomonadota bacterium]
MKGLNAPASETGITHGRRLWLYGLGALLLGFLVLPTLIVIPMSFSASQFLEFPPRHLSLRWYEHYLQSAAWRQATVTSLEVSALTAVLATALGTAAAYGLLNCGMRAARWASAVLLAPIMVPVILVAIGVFYAYVKLRLLNSIAGLVLADSMLAIPIVVLVVSAALRGHDSRQEMAARSLGATRLGAFMRVTLPQIRFAVLTAAVLSFLTGFDEVVIALFISGGDHPTLTRNMFNALRDQIDPTIAAISTLMIAVSTVLLALALIGKPRDGG